jgi:hypothetical protein
MNPDDYITLCARMLEKRKLLDTTKIVITQLIPKGEIVAAVV